MYQLSDPLLKVKGVGVVIAQTLSQQGIKTIQDLLLYLPLNYADLSQVVTIHQLVPNQNYTVRAKVVAISEYFKNGKRITKATIADDTGRTSCIWFNSRFIKQQLKKNKEYFFAGAFTPYRTFSQPKIEIIKQETVHTGRLVPQYSQTLKLKQGKIRLILKEIVTNLAQNKDPLSGKFKLFPLYQALTQLHFPDDPKLVIKARERLALEELLSLMQQSQQIKQAWQHQQAKVVLKTQSTVSQELVQHIPFQLTNDQQQALTQIIADLNQPQPMNRLLIGDVGSGKTIVAALAAQLILQAGYNVALVAPTQILAEQHFQTLSSFFPKTQLKLLTAQTNKKNKNDDSIPRASQSKLDPNQPQSNQTAIFYVGTHAVINSLNSIDPGLVIYDEQHRFGVAQRATASSPSTTKQPHILTMSATPIPRSYMLTIFSHLQVSLIKEFPFGTKNIKTWYVPKTKKADGYQWVIQQLLTKNSQQPIGDPQSEQNLRPLALVICPFIDPSQNQELSQVPSATQVYQQLTQQWGNQLKIELLHGQQKPPDQEKVIKKLFKQKIDLLVATSIVEVGVDLPSANIIIIEGADRFGLASLHQLRGRVGRHSQESYCLVLSASQTPQVKQRLQLFAQENDGLKLAEIDLANRGPGDLFGLAQHGLDNLMFCSWSNLELIATARKIFDQLKNIKTQWQPLFQTDQNLTQDISNN